MNQIRPVDSVAQLAVNVKLLLQMVPCVLVWSSVIVTELSVEMESAEFKVVRIQTASRFTKGAADPEIRASGFAIKCFTCGLSEVLMFSLEL